MDWGCLLRSAGLGACVRVLHARLDIYYIFNACLNLTQIKVWLDGKFWPLDAPGSPPGG